MYGAEAVYCAALASPPDSWPLLTSFFG